MRVWEGKAREKGGENKQESLLALFWLAKISRGRGGGGAYKQGKRGRKGREKADTPDGVPRVNACLPCTLAILAAYRKPARTEGERERERRAEEEDNERMGNEMETEMISSALVQC